MARKLAQSTLKRFRNGLDTISNALPPLPAVEFDASGVRVKTAPVETGSVSLSAQNGLRFL